MIVVGKLVEAVLDMAMVMTRLLFQMELFLFIRKKFTLNDIDNIQSLILDVDYDDAFVAYINGIEIGRKYRW